MAVQTIYLLGTTAVTPNWFGNTQLNGAAPVSANTPFGWVPGKTAITTPYYRGFIGATGTSNVAAAASTIASTPGPTAGTGATSTTAGDSFIAGPFSGTFTNTAWTFNFWMQASTGGGVGNVNLRVWRSANANGSGATEIIPFTSGAIITLSTSGDRNSQITASPGAVTLSNEYLFFQVEWQETTAGGSNNTNVLFRVGDLSIVTPDLGAAASYVDLAGGLIPATTFAADVTVTPATALAGDLAPALAFAADLTVSMAVPVNYVDFSGNLGGVSQYGRLKYGQKHYSRIDALAPAFSADLDIVGQDYFAGDLRPVVTFAGSVGFDQPVDGDIAPGVAFAADLSLAVGLAGDLAPQIALDGSLTGDLSLQGDMPLQVDLQAPGLISGPLWAGTEPCPSPPWTPTEPCPPSLWTPVPPPAFMPPSGGWTEQEKVDDLSVWGDAKK